VTGLLDGGLGQLANAVIRRAGRVRLIFQESTMRNRFAAVLLLCCAAFGCQDATAPLGELTVIGAPAAVLASRPLGGWGFALDVTLKNASSSTIRLSGCGPAVEREVTSGQWETAFEPMCALRTSGDVELPPLTERFLRADLWGLSGQNGPASRYRLVYRYWTVGVWGQAQEARSAPFDLTE
jgi:hypothetical protein